MKGWGDGSEGKYVLFFCDVMSDTAELALERDPLWVVGRSITGVPWCSALGRGVVVVILLPISGSRKCMQLIHLQGNHRRHDHANRSQSQSSATDHACEPDLSGENLRSRCARRCISPKVGPILRCK